ncbi:PH domain-containing protein [Streptomyces sp.]|uniref:PH domain-containing protein n=1 Tax=Streptomyces sp. TaxID=1931 RepID=UPI002F3EBD56
MTSSHDDRPKAPPQFADRVYRSVAGFSGGVLLLALAGWLGGDAIVRGSGRTPWLAMAALLLAVPLIVAFTIRPAVFASTERIRIRNPFRTITLPWAGVDSLRAAYSTELIAGGRTYQVWAVPVSLRARKRAARQDARAKAVGEGGGRADPFGVPAGPIRRRTPVPGADGTIRSASDQALAELRELSERHPVADDESARPAATIRWAYEVIAPAAAGAIVLAVLAGTGG